MSQAERPVAASTGDTSFEEFVAGSSAHLFTLARLLTELRPARGVRRRAAAGPGGPVRPRRHLPRLTPSTPATPGVIRQSPQGFGHGGAAGAVVLREAGDGGQRFPAGPFARAGPAPQAGFGPA